MRTERALKNILTSFISYVLLFIAGIVVRKLALDSFDTELVGYDGLLADLFEYVAALDLGITGILTYRLYEAFTHKNDNRLNKLVSIYRTLSFIVAGLTLIVCIILYLLLPTIFADKVKFWNYFNIMFIMLAATKVNSYIFGYWRTILASAQYEYKAVNIETIISFVGIIIKAIILITTKDYLLYLIFTNGLTILSAILVYLSSKKQFTNLKFVKVSLLDIKNEGIFNECKELVIINLGTTITWSSTSLFISLFIDINTASLFYNYSLISSMCFGVITKIIYPMRSTLADLIYKEDKQTSYNFFELMDLACFFLGTLILCGYTNVYQQAISLFFGEQYLLPMSFVICYAIQNYIATKAESYNSYRTCFGKYNTEVKYSIIGSIVGIIAPLIMSKLIGLPGVIIGLIFAALIKMLGNMVIVIRDFYGKTISSMLQKELKYFLIALTEMITTFFLTYKLSYSFMGLLISAIVSVLVPTLINIFIFRKNDNFYGIKALIVNMLKHKSE